jgi:pimeloyl-ACP methyl ester carboxylesterase
VEVATVDVPGDVPAFVLHGARGAFMVFLHGRCTHGLGYVQAFQFAAAAKGTVIAPQGDQACGSTPFRRWSPDIDKLNARVEAALRAAGYTDPSGWRDMVVIGYSEGASRAEALAQRFPERYSRAILIGAPAPPSAARLAGVRGAVMMAGERDAQETMKIGARALSAAGIPVTYIMIPGASHGQMGDGERVMREALDWLWANAKPAG